MTEFDQMFVRASVYATLAIFNGYVDRNCFQDPGTKESWGIFLEELRLLKRDQMD